MTRITLAEELLLTIKIKEKKNKKTINIHYIIYIFTFEGITIDFSGCTHVVL